MFEDILPHDFYKHKQVLEKVANVLGRSFVKFPKLQEDLIRNNDSLKKVFEEMYGLAGNIGVMVGEKQHTNPNNNYTLSVNRLREQISALCTQLRKISKAALVIVTITQADLSFTERHPLSIDIEKTEFLNLKNSN